MLQVKAFCILYLTEFHSSSRFVLFHLMVKLTKWYLTKINFRERKIDQYSSKILWVSDLYLQMTTFPPCCFTKTNSDAVEMEKFSATNAIIYEI